MGFATQGVGDRATWKALTVGLVLAASCALGGSRFCEGAAILGGYRRCELWYLYSGTFPALWILPGAFPAAVVASIAMRWRALAWIATLVVGATVAQGLVEQVRYRRECAGGPSPDGHSVWGCVANNDSLLWFLDAEYTGNLTGEAP